MKGIRGSVEYEYKLRLRVSFKERVKIIDVFKFHFLRHLYLYKNDCQKEKTCLDTKVT
jgi:hypothetical protein